MKPKEYRVSVSSKIYNPFTNEVVYEGGFEHSFKEDTFEGCLDNFTGETQTEYALDYDTHLTDIGLEEGLPYKSSLTFFDSDEIVALSEDKKTITVKLPFSEVGTGEIKESEGYDRLWKIDDEIFNEDEGYGLLIEYTYKFNQEVEGFYDWTRFIEDGDEEPDFYPYG
jgi:hypothetical protein